MQSDRVASQIDYIASEHLRDIVACLGRTEDVRFSPSNRRLAVAGFFKNKIAVFDILVATSPGSKNIALIGVTEISSTQLNYPHGVDFIDDNKVIVANREGNVCVFEIPNATGKYELAPAFVIESEDISTPGSVAVLEREDGVYETVVCNNYAHKVTRHLLDLGTRAPTKNSEVLFKRWLDMPDGICVTKDQQWIAISNQNLHTVLLYENKPSLSELSHPDGVLRGTHYPHGVRFTSDGRFLFVTSVVSPSVNLYQRDGLGWRGVRHPFSSFRALNDQDFLRGQEKPEGGGPKGIDINDAMNVLVMTCETQPLAFFDLEKILETACNERSDTNCSLSNSRLVEQKASDVVYELGQQEQIKYLQEKLRALQNSKSWRITAPLRWLLTKVRKLQNFPGPA